MEEGERQDPHLDLIHISNPGPGLSKSILESLDVGQVNWDVFCLMDYGLECGWWMLLPKGREKGGLSLGWSNRSETQPDHQII